MAKNKLYAVRRGKSVGIFTTWDKCRAAVEGYPCAEYKSFTSEEEAEAYLSGSESNNTDKIEKINSENQKTVQGQLKAYVDGSFDKSIDKYSFGCVIIKPDGIIVRESGSGDNPETAAIRNVAGEMLGSMFAVKWCDVNGYSDIKIYYDYMGIEMWATGGWKAKNSLTQKYADFMRKYSDKIKISFEKVAAHTGDKYNEEADGLAKAALRNKSGIPKIRHIH